jgi:endonuclease I
MLIKKSLFILLLSLSQFIAAQPPVGYYNNANGLTGYPLKTALKNIISSGHTVRGYNNLYTAYQTTDTDIFYENDNSVLDMYSENPIGVDSFYYTQNNNKCGSYNSESDCYNREHLMPQSIFNSASPMQSDVHFVVPADGYVNGVRSNLPFGVVGTANYVSKNGSKRGNNIALGSFTGTVFEPIDEFKGDIARCLLYFATRYESNVTGWSYSNVLNGTSNQVYTDDFLRLLLTWHLNDTVSPREISRNNACYTYQGNRNPFIDSAHYVTLIWGIPDTVRPTIPLNLVATDTTTTTVDLVWNASADSRGIKEYEIYINGLGLITTTDTNYVVTGLSQNTNYNFLIKAIDSSGIYSLASNTLSLTTLISPASINENVFKSLKIYPNPTSKKSITVSFDNDLKQVEVYSVMGKMITNIVSVYDTKNKINLSNLPSGIFYLKITTEGAAITKKIIVN